MADALPRATDRWDARARELDAADPIAFARERFRLPDGLVYLDGNSLGALTKASAERVARTVSEEWGHGLIGSWNAAGWVDLPGRVGERIAALIGASAGSVVAADSTSVNLFKVLAAALALRPERRVIVSQRANFPTDLYMAEGLAQLLAQGHELRLVDEGADPAGALCERTAVLMLTHVDYRTGAIHDMAALTRAAHAAGALAIWDLAHSAGALELALEASGADFAVGCGYKFLNGGPGAPAFLFVAPRHQGEARQPLSGWFGHSAPFSFEPGYRPSDGIRRFQAGTPSVIALSSLDAALDAFEGVTMSQIRDKSVALTTFFVEAVEALAGPDLRLASPRRGEDRASQVSWRHPDAYALAQALIAHRIVGDFRAPDILRFGFAPLYNRFDEALRAARGIAEVLHAGLHLDPRFQVRNAVT
ncbi:kynureninase [Aureimonas jatrophae]|uniref:Kynureninase n=1 Tax=Aureimonas jatrophae TaxID=1166073 RepID=A0A1H0HQ31_9HYPH|nr:kynureninase [Aureimonas jatrophae]MBB3950695.1 kynureninase [Aureimonas jatrophae]SDO20911.1 Kynureninase [Aureimonas jatrophae]